MTRNYIIFNLSEVNLIDWNQVLGDQSSLRVNVNNDKGIIEYIGSTLPSSLANLTTKQGPYNHAQAIQLMATAEWFQPDENETISDIL